MDTFSINARLWPSGDDLDLGVDTNNVTVPSSFDRHAANFVTLMDGTDTFQFLFRNTGRHLANKRHVAWKFSVGGWGVWNATRWYGVPPAGPGSAQRVRADGFTLGGVALERELEVTPALVGRLEQPRPDGGREVRHRPRQAMTASMYGLITASMRQACAARTSSPRLTMPRSCPHLRIETLDIHEGVTKGVRLAHACRLEAGGMTSAGAPAAR